MKRLGACVLFLLLSACTGLADRAPPPEPAAADGELYLGIVDGLIRQGRYQAATAFLASYQRNRPQTPRFRKLTGDALAGAGRYRDAIAAYRAGLDTPLAAQCWNGMGRVEAMRGDWREAESDFRRATQLDPADNAYLNNLGYALLKQGQYGAALSALQRARELAPGSALVRNNLALAAARAGDGTQLSTLLDTITEPGGRKLVADLTLHWDASWNDDTGSGTGTRP